MTLNLASTQTTHTSRGFLVALFASLALSTTAVFIRYLTQTYALPALVLAFWRDFFVLFTLLALFASRGRLSTLRVEQRHLLFLVGYGGLLALFNACWTLSVAYNGAAVATVLAYSSAAFTVLLGWWLLKERLSWVKLAAVALSLGGCTLVAEALDPAAWGLNLPGILSGLLSGLAYAAYSLLGRSASQRGLSPWTTLTYTFGFAAGFLFLLNLPILGGLPGAALRWGDFFWLGGALTGWVMLFLLAAGPTVAGFGLYNVSLSLLPSSVANLILTSEPVFTALIAYILLGERLSLLQASGGVLILGGMLLLRLFEPGAQT